MRVYLHHRDGVVQEHLVNPYKASSWFSRLVDRTVIARRCDICGLRRCGHEEGYYG